jgi:hypothetical protein
MTPLQLQQQTQSKIAEYRKYEEALRRWPDQQAVSKQVAAFFATALLELELAWRQHPNDAVALLNEICRINHIIDSHKE